MNPDPTTDSTPKSSEPSREDLLEFVREIRKCLGTGEIGIEYWKREAEMLLNPPMTPRKYS